nr:MAG TPA: hypothetical protein [Ackermannviridae sp.]
MLLLRVIEIKLIITLPADCVVNLYPPFFMAINLAIPK